MGVLVPETLERIREALPSDIREKWTDEELDSTAYFLTISGMIPAGQLRFADVDPLTVGLTTNFIASALLPVYLKFGLLDPTVITRFIKDLKENPETQEKFLTRSA